MITDVLLAPLWRGSRRWWLLVLAALGGTLVFVGTIVYSLIAGPGVWGNNIPAAWAYPIVSFVWWIAIGHAGGFLSAVLLLSGRRWRASVHRLMEIMAVGAFVIAGIFPILHLGRQWLFFWLAPYPSTMGVWPQYKSALTWDMATIVSHLTVTALFLYVGLMPDLATARDRAPGRWRRRVYGVLALGWRGAARQWQQHRAANLLLAGLTAVLAVSGEATVSFDFATSIVSGWHSTLLPFYFLVASVYSGTAMLLVTLLPVRRALGLHPFVTERHLDALAQIFLACGVLIAYTFVVEAFVGWYSVGEVGRGALDVEPAVRPYGWWLWVLAGLTVVVPQLFWWPAARRNPLVLFGAATLALIGLFAERFVLVVASLDRGFLPSSWEVYLPTWVDWLILLGSIATFALLLLLAVRFLPVVAIDEIKQLRHELREEAS